MVASEPVSPLASSDLRRPQPRATYHTSHRLKALNEPERVAVTLDANGSPIRVGEGTVETVREIWRIDDEWWRAPISRHYYEVMLEGGGRMIVFLDLVTGEWFRQQP